jgi:two-component system, NarL family, nitrate/nitrite response regulator NarL
VTANDPIRILLVDDHAVVRSGLRLLIEGGPGMAVVAEASNRADALAAARLEKPDLVLLDLDLGGESGLALIPELLDASERTRVLILTGVSDVETQRQAVKLGAAGIVLKTQPAELILKAIGRVHEGEFWLDRVTTASLITELVRQKADPETVKIASLTAREREIIALVGEGLKNEQVAERLFLSSKTVRNHLTSIFDKLDVHDRLELTIYAYRHRLARPPA